MEVASSGEHGWIKVAPGPKHKKTGWVQTGVIVQEGQDRGPRALVMRVNNDAIIASGSLRKRRPKDMLSVAGGGRRRRFSLTGFWCVFFIFILMDRMTEYFTYLMLLLNDYFEKGKRASAR